MSDTYYEQPHLIINGAQIGTSERSATPIVNPATLETLGHLPHATLADLDAALAGAKSGFERWRTVSPQERGRIIKRAADILRARTSELEQLVAQEVGKPVVQGRWEALVAADTLEWFAEEGRRAYGRIIPGQYSGVSFRVVKEPVGPVAAFSAWNFPLINAARKLGAALAAGCSCIYKPAEEAPASGLAVPRALIAAGVPQGVVSVVFGVPAEISSYLLNSPIIRKVSFTGSVPVGKQLTKLAADRGIRTTMELGGHAPVIVCGDVNIEEVAAQAVASKYRNAGQVCVSPTRFYIHESVYERFLDAFARRVNELKIGDGLDPATDVGPLIHQRRRDAIHGLVSEAVEAGAQLVVGGNPLERVGWFYEPTVLAGVPRGARIMKEEPFGPVAIINPYSDLDEVMREANALPYGLAAYAFSESARTLATISSSLEAGMVALNSFVISQPDAPFLGIKESGHGAEAGPEGLEACLVTKVISQAH
ncbi:NAD-dependent succinate-semialdehyde dehydrogenase [Cupriavidus basilensis]